MQGAKTIARALVDIRLWASSFVTLNIKRKYTSGEAMHRMSNIHPSHMQWFITSQDEK